MDLLDRLVHCVEGARTELALFGSMVSVSLRGAYPRLFFTIVGYGHRLEMMVCINAVNCRHRWPSRTS
ncbi:MAG: hypothetical protein CBE00_10010 [Planctomycetaceae bacterium TMED240]|nr:hypothetical protein [Rhodopirellula sp.]OUX05559.1 MAG: hypothetical protein CBE00_10010 [Planctomycetaceae bacterium TMED240]